MTGRAALVAALLLGACDGDDSPTQPKPSASTSPWEIGPIIKRDGNARNYSLGLPSTPTKVADGWSFAIGPRQQPHYVTLRHGSLRGKSQIKLKFRVDGPPTATISAGPNSDGTPCTGPSAVLLYFQKSGDDWATDGARWWHAPSQVALSAPIPETEIIAPLNAGWSSVLTMKQATNLPQFTAAKDGAERVGFTFANCAGYGHGAMASEKVQFVITDFKVE